MSRFIYADHAGTTALSQTALAAMRPCQITVEHET